MNKTLQTLMEKEMTRREFLTACGLGLASLFGFGAVIRLLTAKEQSSQAVTNGYGAHRYGR